MKGESCGRCCEVRLPRSGLARLIWSTKHCTLATEGRWYFGHAIYVCELVFSGTMFLWPGHALYVCELIFNTAMVSST
jgi:hypothetical protein